FQASGYFRRIPCQNAKKSRMNHTTRLIIVSNRLPYRIERRNDEIEIRKSSGGLVSALDSSLTGDRQVLWVGAADFSPERWKQFSEQPISETLQYAISPVFPDKR